MAGLVTILAPCIWPVLPIIFSTSAGGKQKPLGITLGVMVSFTFFTLAISYLVKLFGIDPNALRLSAVVILIALGLTLIIPSLQSKFEIMVTRLSNLFGTRGQAGSDFLAGFVTGISLGIVWTPCAGPILATIATLAATGKVTFFVVLLTVSYVVGVGIPLFAFSYGSQKLIGRLKGLGKYTSRIQQVFGFVIILAAIAIYTNFDQTLQLALVSKFPALGTALNGFESGNLVTTQLNNLKGSGPGQNLNSDLFNADYRAPDFSGITNWLNTDKPLSIKDLKGKVVLVDFWTYTCINCIRTLPHVTSWYSKYKDEGFVVVGVHTPEFQFEHETSNVEDAIKMYNIDYPVAQDNNYATWNAYSNQYWPAEYLIDSNGIVRRVHFGEGEYDQTEEAIRELLKEAGNSVTSSVGNMPDQTPTGSISPETYLGSARMEYYFGVGNLSNGTQDFNLSDSLSKNSFSYGGTWTITNEYAQAGDNASLNYNFSANKVYIILDPAVAGENAVKVFLDGKPIDASVAGSDVKNGILMVDTDRLYNIVDLHGNAGNHTLLLQLSPGIQAFTFTFG